jgi:hypothetical protein
VDAVPQLVPATRAAAWWRCGPATRASTCAPSRNRAWSDYTLA